MIAGNSIHHLKAMLSKVFLLALRLVSKLSSYLPPDLPQTFKKYLQLHNILLSIKKDADCMVVIFTSMKDWEGHEGMITSGYHFYL